MSESSTPRPRVSIRSIAASVGVSIMTVSLALRNHPKISAATRKRVQQAAQRLGYRPDPEIARLMTRLHHGRQSNNAPPLALVDLSAARLPAGSENYCERVRRGAAARAEELGYIAASFHQLDYEGDLRRLLKVIHYRGIRGVLLLPPLQPVELPTGLDWSPFSVIIASYAITPLEFHRVVPHQFVDMGRLIRLLEARGYRRIGAVFAAGFEERIHHHFTAAFSLLKYDDNILRVADPRSISRREFAAWLHSVRPDVLVSTHANEVLAALPPASAEFTPPAVVSLGAGRDPSLPFWDERPEEIGAVAAILLAGMIQHNETGIPESPRTSMIHGVFREVPEQPAAPVKRAAKRKRASPR